ncbi:MAG: response regulator transcription factor [Ilumatobacteraceae bacterium]
MALPEIVVVHARRGDTSIVASRLETAPFNVSFVPISRAMIDLVRCSRPDVVVIDHVDGAFDLVRVCRDLGSSIDSWIIVLSGEPGDPDDRSVRLLEAGADVTLDRDASPELLRAYVRVGLRDRPTAQRAADQIHVGDVIVDLDAHMVLVGGEAVQCPPRQFQLLAELARHPNVAIAHEQLMTIVWGQQPSVVDPRRLRMAVGLLRSLLGSGPSRPRIETVPHVGYRLTVNPTRATEPDGPRSPSASAMQRTPTPTVQRP